MSEEKDPPTPVAAEGPSPSGPTPDAAPEPTPQASAEPSSPSPTRSMKKNRFWLLLLGFLIVSQSLLVVAAYVPDWWASLPVLSLLGVVGWRSRWFFSPLLGFVLGFGYWGVELELLPGGPRARLAGIIAAGLGLSPSSGPTIVLLIGPLLLGVLAAFGAMTVTGALRLWDGMRAPEPGLREVAPPPASAVQEA